MKTAIRCLLVILGLLTAAGGVQGGTFSDSFTNGLNPAYWGVIQTTANFYSVNIPQGCVNLAKGAASNPGDLQAVSIRLNLAELGGVISTGFSTQVSFTNAVIPGPRLDKIELHTYYEDGSIYFGSYDNSSGVNAHVWDGSSTRGVTPATGNSGTFTITRTGSNVSAYFNGTLLYTESRPSPLMAIEFVLQNNNGSSDATSVSFYNFSLTSPSVSLPPALSGPFYFVSISNLANFSWADTQTIPGEPAASRLPGAPIGMVTLEGVPFNIASNAAGNQAWHADIAAGGNSGEVSITANVNVYGVTNVYSLINTWEGQTNVYAWLVFTGSSGTIYTNDLVGGVDIRDYNAAIWENDITSPTTINVFGCPFDNWGTPGRLDLQHIALPPEFATQTLVSIQLVDNGGPNIQRTILDGLTMQTAPVPELTITGNASLITVTWPVALGGLLQTNGNLDTTNWVNYSGQISPVGGTNIVTIIPSIADLFFRLSPP